MTKSLVVAAALLAQDCSIVTTKNAPDTLSPQQPPDCTTSKAAVYGDGLIAGAAAATSLFLGLAALAKEADLADNETNKLAHATLYTFLGGVGFSISGVIGGVRVSGCRSAHDKWRMQQQQQAYPPYPPGGYPAPYPQPTPTPAQ